MVALAVKGGSRVIGKNNLFRKATTIDNSYRALCGIHAELDVWRQAPDFTNGTIYVVGKIADTGSRMKNTAPCPQCSAILSEMGVRSVVFYRRDVAEKLLVKDLLELHFGGVNVC